MRHAQAAARMGRGWAVGSSTGLALAGTQLVLQAREAGATSMTEPVFVLETLALLAALAAWAYAISTGSHGSKGALAALIVFALGANVAMEGILAAMPGFDRHPVLMILLALANVGVGLGTAGSLLRELRERRGPVQWGTATFFALPLLLWIALAFAAKQVGA